ncbi:hypothetical protein N7468_006924 [Penicillium chermesinum]|uniref:Initiation-specific alpha-1,6-mannosyltransferase n=1 Tax=Penicillium chermesinum TaxID=63820 RepID=A0A9W9NVZ2_9EURO|nr:uncharacterized protein N7468_006924 [Penicillium chermesinum]KAJ5225699.1 hypothetical protein N7468_006924 [Penicillium chermesinum]
MAFTRSYHLLLTLLLAFIGSLIWFSWDLQDSIPSWTNVRNNHCSCGPDASPDKTFEASPNATPSTLVSSSSEPTPAPATQDLSLFPLPEPLPRDQLDIVPFPAKVWQKAGSHGVDDARIPDLKSWQKVNPDLRQEILTDGAGDHYVRDNYAAYPDLLNLYLSLNVPILKADLLRHLILYAEGGIWSDLDVTCELPVDTWIPEEYRNRTNVVFASWTVMAKPRTSHIAAVIRYVVNELEASADDYNTTIAGLTMQTISDVVDVTGPQAMTRAILGNLEAELKTPVGRPNISSLSEPRLIGDVLILPNAAFSATQAGYPKDRGPYLVTHHYAGSWKNTKGGEADKEVKQEPEVVVVEVPEVKEESKPVDAVAPPQVTGEKKTTELEGMKGPDEEIIHVHGAASDTTTAV